MNFTYSNSESRAWDVGEIIYADVNGPTAEGYRGGKIFSSLS